MGDFGSIVSPTHFIEWTNARPVVGNVPDRPAPGTVVMVRDWTTKGSLAPVTIGDGGHWSATYPGVDMIEVSTDNGVTWRGPLISPAHMAAIVATTGAASASATSAATSAAQSLALAQSAQAAAYATPDAAMRDILANPASLSRSALDAALSRHITTGVGDETSIIQTWLDTPSPLAVKQLIGAASLAATLVVPPGVTLDLTSATLTNTKPGKPKVTVQVGAGATLRGGRIVMDPADYVSNASPTCIGVDVTGAGATIAGVTITGAAGVGIRVGADDVTVTGCTIVGPGPARISGGITDGTCYGILTVAAARPLLTSNRISETSQGIATDSDSTAPHIIGNIIRDIRGQHGMYLHRIAGAIVTGNRVDGTYYNGIKAQIDSLVPDDVTAALIADNVVIHAGQGQAIDAIVVNNAVAPYARKLVGLTVTGNVVVNCGRGINLGSIRGATVDGNVLRSLDGTGYTLADCEDVDLSVGSISQVGGTAILLNSMGTTSNARITIRDGRLHNYGGTGTSGANFGVHIVKGTDITVTNITGTAINGSASYLVFNASGDQATLTLRNLACSGTAAQPIRLINDGVAPRELSNVPSPVLYLPSTPVRVGSLGHLGLYIAATLPTSGIYGAGDSITSTAPTAGGSPGWVCTTAGGAVTGSRADNAVVTLGEWRRSSGGRVLECTGAGTTDVAEPTIPAVVNQVVTDGTVTWTVRALAPVAFRSVAGLAT